jgi:Tol biopolymer transport system component
MVSNTQREQSPIAAEYLSGIGVSPNGDQLIINLEIYPDNGDKTWESFLVNIEKGTTEPILDDEQATGVSWSPDVKRIAFIREVLHLDGYLVTQNLETDCETVAPFPPKIHSPSWSDDPAKLVFLYEGLIHIWEIGASFQEGGLEGCP